MNQNVYTIVIFIIRKRIENINIDIDKYIFLYKSLDLENYFLDANTILHNI